jgi:hypothetical protein
MDSAVEMTRYGARLALFGSGQATGCPLTAGADDRPAEPDNVLSLDTARTQKATRDWWRSQGY